MQSYLMERSFLQGYLINGKFSSCFLPPDNVTLQYHFNHFQSSLKTKHCLDIQQDDLSVRFLLNESQLVHKTTTHRLTSPNTVGSQGLQESLRDEV